MLSLKFVVKFLIGDLVFNLKLFVDVRREVVPLLMQRLLEKIFLKALEVHIDYAQVPRHIAPY